MSNATAPRLRADAQRNRDRLVEIARAAFLEGEAPTLDAIAREAGVGIGTLYRHFPTREALVEAVYRSELEAVSASARQLLAESPPDVALRRWMDRYGDFVRTKRGMADAFRAILAAGAGAGTRPRIAAAVAAMLEAGARAGVLRGDVEADDVVVALLGAFLATPDPDQEAQTGRLLDLLLDGLRPR
ncbi:TetR/AcrR family transcriptional regulator [Amnibacterium setariae]|uniref:TetR/AcrR family transcriptional regulator n=1 Tax=Amnibacterium setariae TaxID=2306585 RepID=A0A3A1U1D5_9MICO|nr:TetR/AcrR family transcriptional regulator [Amnibacterium setariae]RIX30173.1 TetR/AcrR family transcriptional regulator [Amnibacterium setariae]